MTLYHPSANPYEKEHLYECVDCGARVASATLPECPDCASGDVRNISVARE
jgi:ABC-type ATPase with predicted acetyltransferase domain